MAAATAVALAPALALGGPLGVKGLYPYGSIMKRTASSVWLVRLGGIPFCDRLQHTKSFPSRAAAHADLQHKRIEYNAYSVFYWSEGSVLHMVNRKHADQVMLFDADQFSIASAYHWCPRKQPNGRFFVATSLKGHQTLLAHRLLAGASFQGHINGNTLDNRAANLAKSAPTKRVHIRITDDDDDDGSKKKRVSAPHPPPPPLPEPVLSRACAETPSLLTLEEPLLLDQLFASWINEFS